MPEIKVRTSEGSEYGYYSSGNDCIYSDSGRLDVDSDGYVHDQNGNVTGRLRSDGTVESC